MHLIGAVLHENWKKDTKEDLCKITIKDKGQQLYLVFNPLNPLEIFGSISVSGQLPTYPSPNPTLTLNCYQLTVVGLGEG